MQFAITIVLTAAVLLVRPGHAAYHPDPWGENLMPRLRVNYLSQKTGKEKKTAAAIFKWNNMERWEFRLNLAVSSFFFKNSIREKSSRFVPIKREKESLQL